MSVLMISNFISCVNDYRAHLCSHWLLNTHVPGLVMVAVAVRCGGFLPHCSQLLWLQMKLLFNQVVRDYLTCALDHVIVEAMVPSD